MPSTLLFFKDCPPEGLPFPQIFTGSPEQAHSKWSKDQGTTGFLPCAPRPPSRGYGTLPTWTTTAL